MLKKTLSFAAVSLFAVACGGDKSGGDIAARAEKAAKAACECKTAECTREHIQALNKMSIKESEAVGKLAEDRKAVYDAAQSSAADCQMKLKAAGN